VEAVKKWLGEFARNMGERILEDRKANKRLPRLLESECLLVEAEFGSVLMLVLLIMTVLMLLLWYG
jgi:hypothetical protein